MPVESHDVIRIYDRAGTVVFERDWGGNRPAALQEEARIVDDLLRLDLLSFRARYLLSMEDPPAGFSPESGPEGNAEGTSG